MEDKYKRELERIEKLVKERTEVITLDNGLKVIVGRDPDAPGLFRGDIYIDFGSKDEKPEDSGIAHFLEHMCFNSTKKFPSKESIDKAMKKLGGRLNANTNVSRISFPLSGLDEDFEPTLDLATQLCFGQVFNDEYLEKEKAVVINEMRGGYSNIDNIVGMWSWVCFEKAFPFRHPTLGNEKSVNAITLEKLVNYRDRFMVPNNSYLTIVGNIDDSKIQTVKSLVSNFKPGEVPERNFSTDNSICEAQFNQEYFDGLKRGKIIYYFRAPKVQCLEVQHLGLARCVLTEITEARLQNSLREKNGLTYWVHSGINSSEHNGTFYINLDIEPKDIDKSLSLLDEELKKLCEYGVTDEELNEAKKQAFRGFLWNYSGTGSLTDIRFNKDKFRYDNLDCYKALFSATKEDVQRAAQKYLRPENSVVNVALPNI